MWRTATAAAAAGGFRWRPPSVRPPQLPPPTSLPPPPSLSGLNYVRDHARRPRFFSQATSFSTPETDDLGKGPSPFSGDFDVADADSGGLKDDGGGGEPKAPPLGAFEAVGVDREQVEGVLSVLQSSLARPLESTLGDLGLALSEEFVVRVVETPLVLGQNLIGFFRWAWKQPDFVASSRVVGCLVRAIGVDCRKKDVYALWDLIKEIGEEEEKGVVTAQTLNDLISMLLRLSKGKAALEVYNMFEEFGCERDVETLYLTIEALCTRRMYDDASSICAKLLDTGKLPGDDKIGKLVVSLCKGYLSKDAHLVYLLAKESGKCVPKSSVNFLIGKLCEKDETVGVALGMLDDFDGDNRKRAIKPFSFVLRALCRIKDMDGAKKLLSKMIEDGPLPGNAAFNLVICGLSKAADVEEAIQWMKVMEGRGLRPDVYTYSVVMSGYAKGGQMDDAAKVFGEAKKVHPKLGPVPYHILIRGHCKLEEFDKAMEYFREMKENGVNPNHDEYNKLIQSLCLKGMDWRTSEVLLEEMKENGLRLNGITRGLIRAVKELEEEVQSSEAVVEA